MLNFITGNFYIIGEEFIYVLHTKSLFIPFILLTLEEMGVPMPVPGDISVTYLGLQVSKGALSFPMALLLVLLSILIGATILYTFSYLWGEKIILFLGKYIHFNKSKLISLEKKYNKYGPLLIIFGRHVPGLLYPITIFSGISKIPYPLFLTYVIISKIFIVPIYLTLGEKFGTKTMRFFHLIPRNIFLIPSIIIVGYIIYLFYKKRKSKNK